MNHQSTNNFESWDQEFDLTGPLTVHLSSNSSDNEHTGEFNAIKGLGAEERGDTEGTDFVREFTGVKADKFEYAESLDEMEGIEDDQTLYSKNETIKGLLGEFSTLTLAASTTSLSSSTSTDPNTPTPHQYHAFSSTPTTSVASTSSNITPGTIMNLNSSRSRQFQAADIDWDEDMDFDLPSATHLRLKPATSFTTVIPSDSEDNRTENLLPTPKTERNFSARSFTSIHSEGEQDDGLDESDYDLPGDFKKFSFTPSLSRSEPTALQPDRQTSSTLHAPNHSHQIPSPEHSWGDEDDGDDDESFFDELVIPSYFSGGPGALTPPSDGEFRRGKIDLQGILRRKLESRNKEHESKSGDSVKGPSRLDAYKETTKDQLEEYGFEIEEGVKLGSGRLRSSSGSNLLLSRSGSLASQSTPTQLRRPPILNRVNNPSNAPSATRSSVNQSRGTFGLGRPSTSRPVPIAPSARSGGTVAVTPSRERTLPKTPALQPFTSPATSNPPTFSSNLHSTPVGRRLAPPRIDTTLPSPRTIRNPTATPSRDSANNNQLQSKKSQGNLIVTSATRGTSLERKRSLQNMKSPTVPTTTTTGSRRPPTPSSSQTTPRTGRSTPSFSSGTFASTGRVRDRVSSTTSSDRPPSRNSNSNSSHHASSSSISTTSRLSQPTLASQAKRRVPASPSSFSSSSINIPPTPLQVSKPKRSRDYGNGMELDGFDDLVISKEREARVVIPLSSSTTVGKSQYRRSGSGTTGSSISSLKSFSSGGSISSISGKKFAGVSVSNVAAGKRAKVESSEESNEKLVSRGAGPPAKKRGLKKEPQLIKNLGNKGGIKCKSSTILRVVYSLIISCLAQGEMTWDPIQQKWQGNESALRDFEKIISTSARPALITNSPARFGLQKSSSLSTLTPQSFDSPTLFNRSNVKVVGSMIFDPELMKWLSLAPEGEDELDLAAEGGDDEDDGWELGENARMLKNRASFVMSEGSRDGEIDDDGEGGGLWNETVEAERRHENEMKSWTVRGEIGRKGLDLRTVSSLLVFIEMRFEFLIHFILLSQLILAETPPRK